MYSLPLTSVTWLPRPDARMAPSLRFPSVPPARYFAALAASSISRALRLSSDMGAAPFHESDCPPDGTASPGTCQTRARISRTVGRREPDQGEASGGGSPDAARERSP